MIVHVVKPGENWWKIGSLYGVRVDQLKASNGLRTDALEPGIALLVPVPPAYTLRQYKVARGDTVWQIAARSRIPVALITASNPAPGRYGLVPGQTLLLPAPVTSRKQIETNAYLILTGGTRDAELIQVYSDVLTYVSLFAYRVTAEGELIRPKMGSLPTAGVKYLMVIANTLPSGQFSVETAHSILSRPEIRRKLIQLIVQELKQRGWAGVDLDIERIPPDDRALYNNFVREVVQALKPLGYIVSIAVPPKPYDNPRNEWVGAFDYRSLGASVDRVMLMTYDWGFPQGRPQAVAPVDKIRGVLDYAFSLMDSRKVLLGMPLYGYDWPLPHSPDRPGKFIVNQTALEQALVQGVPVQIDTTAVAPYYFYKTHNANRIVWFNDGLSVLAKFRLVYEYNMRGVFYWALGFNFPQNWPLLRDLFRIL